MQIRAKLTFTYLFSTALLIGIAFLLIFYFSSQNERSDFRNQLYKKASTTANLLISVKEVDSTLLKIIDQNKRDIYSFENISIYDYNGKELYTNNDSLHFDDFVGDFPSVLDKLFRESYIELMANNMEIVGGVHSFKGEKYAFVAGAEDTNGALFLNGLKRTLFYVYFSILCITGFVGWVYAGRALKPIIKVMNEMDLITASNLNARLKNTGNKDEISRLITTFNDLLSRLQQSFNDQKSFVSYASHELNNPLASINTNIDVSLLNTRSSEEYAKTLKLIKDDILRLQDITGQLLLLSRINSESEVLSESNIRIDDLILEVKEQLKSKFPEADINISFHLPDQESDLLISGNKVLLRSVIYNLVENGIKYSTDRRVSVCLEVNKVPIIEISNHTNNLTEKDIKLIFEPFYRNNSSQTQKGYGLGLAIVRRIVDVNNFKLHVEVKDEVVKFTLMLG
jgi:signal transduction histidine kinase